ncbi:MAG: Vgb family protein [Solirubrobacterales bacterium]
MRLRYTATIAIAVLAALPATAQAAPNLAGTSNVSGVPGEMAKGSDDNVWVTVEGKLARVKPSGNVTEFDPIEFMGIRGITSGPDGRLWLTKPNNVVEVNPQNPNNPDQHPIAAITDPRGITSGPQGKLWAASGDQLVSFKPDNPANFNAQTINGMSARGIAASGGKLWIADAGSGRIIKVTPKAGDDEVKRYLTGGMPQEVSSGPNGGIAYANPGTDPQTVGRVSAGGHPNTTNVPMSDPFGIDFMNDGRWWFAEFAKSKLGILTQGGAVSQFDLPNNSGPRYLTKGKGGTLYVSLETSEKIARVTGIN